MNTEWRPSKSREFFKKKINTNKPIDTLIPDLRGQKVILDADLAKLYGVPTKRLNEAVKRNANRFPEDFLWQLTASELIHMKSQFATASGISRPESQMIQSHCPLRRMLTADAATSPTPSPNTAR
jgi:ORF6N domain